MMPSWNQVVGFLTDWEGLRRMAACEYKCIFIWGGGEKTSRVLNEYGREGWELVCTYWCWHYMKRVLA
jgi:hypothetical protein